MVVFVLGEGATIIIRSRNPGEQGSKAKVKANLACVASVSSRVVRAGAKKKSKLILQSVVLGWVFDSMTPDS